MAIITSNILLSVFKVMNKYFSTLHSHSSGAESADFQKETALLLSRLHVVHGSAFSPRGISHDAKMRAKCDKLRHTNGSKC